MKIIVGEKNQNSSYHGEINNWILVILISVLKSINFVEKHNTQKTNSPFLVVKCHRKRNRKNGSGFVESGKD